MQMSGKAHIIYIRANMSLISQIIPRYSSSVAIQNRTNARLRSCAVALEAEVENLRSNITAAVSTFGPYSCQNTSVAKILRTPRTRCCDRTEFCCPDNSTYIKTSYLATDYCYACTPGMYYDSTTQNCLGCPVNMYQNISGQASCVQCPSGSGTLRTHSKKCLDLGADCLLL
ncbi:signal peptide, CUB and EGF-like domain-containing protein 2 [Rhopilema esculentum]|uniref:signal peptide, CUB and EGF-like domain-containing protein 2 n=1 Tax=Rhopilema esculentum TaxID=499914 RepID=UPI0031E446FC